jgi:hypothetical protein
MARFRLCLDAAAYGCEGRSLRRQQGRSGEAGVGTRKTGYNGTSEGLEFHGAAMKSIADQLPAEIARQIHLDRLKNEAAYWAARGQLLDQYRGQWIGFADGKVIASGSSPVAVFHAAEATGLHPFFIWVGREEEPCRIRRRPRKRWPACRWHMIRRADELESLLHN